MYCYDFYSDDKIFFLVSLGYVGIGLNINKILM